MSPFILLAALLLFTHSAHSNAVKAARHAYTSDSSKSNAFASSFSSSGSFGSGAKASASFPDNLGHAGFPGDISNIAFWWAEPDSPFKQAYEYFRRCTLKGNCANLPGPFNYYGLHGGIPGNLPENGCNANGCSFSGDFNLNDKHHGGKESGSAFDLKPVDISKNPFLNGEYQGVAISSCSGNACPGGKPQTTITTTNCKGSDCKTATHTGTPAEVNLSNNPFLSGSFAGFGALGGSGCAEGKSGCAAGTGTQIGTSYHGSTGSESFSSSLGSGFSGGGGCSGSGCGAVPDVGCAGVKGGCRGQSQPGGTFGGGSTLGTSFGHTGVGVFGSGSDHSTTASGTFGQTGTANVFGQSGTASGSTSFSGSGAGNIAGGVFGQTSSTFGKPGAVDTHTGTTTATGTFGHSGFSSNAFGQSSATTGSFGQSGTTRGTTTGTVGYQPGVQQAIPTAFPKEHPSKPIPTTYPGAGNTLISGNEVSPQPGQPESGSHTGYPAQPGQSGQPGRSGQTERPGYSGQSIGRPTQYDYPKQTVQSGYPDQSSQLGRPKQPGYSGQAGQSGFPDQPSQFGRPSQPGYQGQPGQAEQPSRPGQAGVTGQPGQPGKPGQSAQPGQPGYFPSGQTDFTSGSQYGQTTTSFGGSTLGSSSTSASFGTTSAVTGSSGCKPDHPDQLGCTPVPQQGQPSYSCRPGQIGCQSGYPERPEYSQQSGQPGSPGQPEYPEHPGQPGYTGQPGQPGQAGQPGHPGQERYPVYPGQSEQTQQPGHPRQPGQSAQAEHPVKPGQSGYPGQPTYASGCRPDQPDCTSGSQAGQPSYASSCEPGQPGCTIGPVPGRPDYSGSRPSYGSGCQPGQPGCRYQPGQPSYTSGCQAGQPGCTSGSQPLYSGSQTGFTGSPFGKTTPGQGPGQSSQPGADGQLTIKCSGQGYLCVKKYLCVNGYVNKHGEGLLQVRDGDNYCDVNTETCCRLPGSSGEPHKEHHLQLPGVTGQSFFTSSAQQSSSAASSSASSSSSSSGTTFFTSNGAFPTPSTGVSSRFTPGGVQRVPDSSAAGSQPGVSTFGPKDNYKPGQYTPFSGRGGSSPGLVHVPPNGATETTKPALIHYGPSETTRPQGGLVHVPPAAGVPTAKPSLIHVTPTANDLTIPRDSPGFASTLKGTGYLPPGPSPSPSASSYTPGLLPPNRSQRPNFIPVSSSTPGPNVYVSQTSPQPSTYYPGTKQTFPTTPTYIPPASRRPGVTNAYLPPGSNQVGSASGAPSDYLPPPKKPSDSKIININVLPLKPPSDRIPDDTKSRETVIRPTTEFPFGGDLNTTPYPGCAAALKCVQGDFCTAEGVISPTRVVLTKEQQINRVPLTECQDLETGLIGKCCRDPTYKDPWPASQLGLYNPDNRFDNGQYKPNNRNNGKYQPNNGVKGGQPVQPFEPNRIGSPSGSPNAFVRPGGFLTNLPNAPYDSRQVNVPGAVGFSQTNANPFYPSKISTETCGIRHPESTPAGPGPIDAAFAEIPWQAMVLRDTNRSLLCGGAIISRNAVLTAAHCVENLRADDVLVKGGEWKLGIDEEPKPFQINKVASIVRHPGYNPRTKLNDVAILFLTEKFRLDKNVDTLCLPAPGEDVAVTFQKASCITTGWGKTVLQLNILNSIMHILGVGVIPSGQCQSMLQQYHKDSAYLYNTNCVCGAPVQPQADICDVDVGSALACDRGDGRYTLAGIYSWDTGCNPTAQVAGYTKVDTQWVEATLQRPVQDLQTEESGFYQKLAEECRCT